VVFRSCTDLLVPEQPELGLLGTRRPREPLVKVAQPGLHGALPRVLLALKPGLHRVQLFAQLLDALLRGRAVTVAYFRA
jgi:hypothetical protein